MRTPDERIKAAILHPEGKVRLTAVRYFSQTYNADATIMPIVAEALDRYDHRTNEDILWLCHFLPQSASTIDWLMAKLQKPVDVDDYEQDNHRYALAEVLLWADPNLLARRHSEILALPSFPAPMHYLLDELLKVEFMDWPDLWATFEETGQRGMEPGRYTLHDNRRLHWIVRAMTRHRSDATEAVLSLLQDRFRSKIERAMPWMAPWLVELAGALRLEEAIPYLIKRIDDDDEDLLGHLGTALRRIGGDGVIEVVAKKWRKTEAGRRFTLAEPLENIHSTLAVERILWLLEREEDFAHRVALACAATSQFATECIEPVRQVLLEKETVDTGEFTDLRNQLVATATIMGETFPEYQGWHDEAVATDYGYETIKDMIEPHRRSDAYIDEEFRGRPLRRIRPKTKALYQLKITLQEIEPLIWRQVLVPDCTLDELHEVIQIVMGWESYHLYSFKIGQKEFTRPDMDDGELNMEDSISAHLSKLLKKAKQRFSYEYDFGDGWGHEIVVEEIGNAAPDTKYPLCVAGKRSCPPEDVGGPWGYAEYLEALADPDHERHEEMLGWRGKFDAEAFTLDAVNKALRKVFR